MSKALVIKGANYSANKVATIEFDEEVPCTGIEFDSSTISVSGYTPVEAEYTVTPENTTDSIVWQSSNTNILTVNDGVITPIGVGTATVTATCGNYSASVSVTVDISYLPMYTFSNISQNGTAPNKFLGNSDSYNRIMANGSGAQAGVYKCYGQQGATSKNIIKLPGNTGSVKLKNTNKNVVYDGGYANICWLSDESCGASGFEEYALLISVEGFNFYTEQEKTFNVPQGANAMMFVMRTNSTYTDQDDPNSIATNAGLTITFNPVAE